MKKILLFTGLCLSPVLNAEPARVLPPIINNSTYANGAPYKGTTAANKPMLEMLSRVESLQDELQQLRGLSEEQANEIKNLKKRQNNSYVDIDSRLRKLEVSASGMARSRVTYPSAAAASVAVNTAIAEPVTSSAPSTEYRATAATPTTIVAEQYEEQSLSYVPPTPVASVAAETTAAPVQKTRASEKAAFDSAFASVKGNQYELAIQQFSQFLIDYPNSSYSDNATFWLASVYKVVHDSRAKETFTAVYTQFPNSEKAAMAMLRLGDIYREENDSLNAESMYTQVIGKYEGSTAADMAISKLQSIGQ
ncbi:MAG: tol-pal system protein YbgF [Methyloprofundus sp.]|nr:tol-pal system protein YbgF [Methyloprofundus sp.]